MKIRIKVPAFMAQAVDVGIVSKEQLEELVEEGIAEAENSELGKLCKGLLKEILEEEK